jgi:hypothetical protein
MPQSRALARLLTVSVVSGIVLGIAARLVMRFIALESGLPGSYSLGGSLEVAAFGAMLGTPLAFAFLMLRRWFFIPPPWAGLLFGLALFAVLSILRPPSAQSALAGTPDTPMATGLAFALLFVLWGIGLDLIGRRLLPNKQRMAATTR